MQFKWIDAHTQVGKFECSNIGVVSNTSDVHLMNLYCLYINMEYILIYFQNVM